MYDQQTGGIVRANVCTRVASSGDKTMSQAARPMMILPRFSSCKIGAKDWREIISKAKFATTVQKRNELPKATPGGAVMGRASKKSNAWAGSSEAVTTFHQCSSADLGSSSLVVLSNSSGEGRGLLSLEGRRRASPSSVRLLPSSDPYSSSSISIKGPAVSAKGCGCNLRAGSVFPARLAVTVSGSDVSAQICNLPGTRFSQMACKTIKPLSPLAAHYNLFRPLR